MALSGTQFGNLVGLINERRRLWAFLSALALFGAAFGLGSLIGAAFKMSRHSGSGPIHFDSAQAPLGSGTDALMNPEAKLALDATVLNAGYWAPWCDSASEVRASELRRACGLMSPKARRFWQNFDEAEKESIRRLQAGDFSTLGDYISCDAADLTWYELLCASDLEPVTPDALAAVLNQAGPAALAVAHWKRDPSSGGVSRSRLVSPLFRLGDPWTTSDEHPELQTLLLLEKKTDGRIYIGGAPVTGVSAQSQFVLE